MGLGRPREALGHPALLQPTSSRAFSPRRRQGSPRPDRPGVFSPIPTSINPSFSSQPAKRVTAPQPINDPSRPDRQKVRAMLANERADRHGGGGCENPIEKLSGPKKVRKRSCFSHRRCALPPTRAFSLIALPRLVNKWQEGTSLSPIGRLCCLTGIQFSQLLPVRTPPIPSLAKWRRQLPPRLLLRSPQCRARRRRHPPHRWETLPPPPRHRRPPPRHRHPRPRRCRPRSRAPSPAAAWCGCTRLCSPPSWTASSGATKARRGSSGRCWVRAAALPRPPLTWG